MYSIVSVLINAERMLSLNGVMDFNALGIAFIDDAIQKRHAKKINRKMEELQEKMREDFELWLDSHGYESVMGIIIKKGTVKFYDSNND